MNSRYFQASSIFLALAAAALSGCSGEPSSSDIEKLVETEIKPAAELQAQMMTRAIGGTAAHFKPKLSDVNKIGCKADGEAAYACDVELVIETAEGDKSKIVPMRLVKGSSGWVLSQ